VPFGFGIPDPDSPGASGGPGPSGPFDMASLGAVLQQLGQYLQQSGTGAPSGPVNWTLVEDSAKGALAAAGGAGEVTDSDREWVLESCRLADLWLDAGTTFPAGGSAPLAWSRQDWISQTIPAWRRYVEPVAERMIDVLGSSAGGDVSQMSAEDLQAALPEQLRGMLPEGVPPQMMAMLQPMIGMMRQLSVAAFSMQLGQGLAALAREVLSAGDIGIPLQEASQVAVLPANVAEFGSGIGIPEAEIRLYLVLRESAHQRLFAHVPWLRGRLAGAIEEVARGVSVDVDRLQQAAAEVDMSDPAALQQLMSSGLLQPEQTPAQRAALVRLETLLALVEGWVEDVVGVAVTDRLTSAGALRETVRRRRAAGGPAERAFANLVGLELRPKAIREAATLFAAVREMRDAEVRDGLWSHPDLIPDSEDLADPLGFVERLGDR
jgi:putative hydrolase